MTRRLQKRALNDGMMVRGILDVEIFETLSDIYLTTQCNMDAFKGKYERTSADQYDEFMKVHIDFKKVTTIIIL